MLIKKINITLLIIIEYLYFWSEKIFYNDIIQLSIIIKKFKL